MMSTESIKLHSKEFAPLMTCPICKKLFKNPVAISECLHTFCKKCIYKKMTEEEQNSCPVCYKYLGCAPLTKLRPDYNWKSLKVKVDSSVANMPTIPLHPRRKERSLSSLANTINVSIKTVMQEKRKPTARKGPISQKSDLLIKEPIKKMECRPESSSTPSILRKNPYNRKQKCSMTESSKKQLHNKGTGITNKPLEGMADLWQPLTSMAEAASIENPHKSSLEGFVSKATPFGNDKGEENVSKGKGMECGTMSKANNRNDGNGGENGLKAKRIYRSRQKTAVEPLKGSNVAPQADVNVAPPEGSSVAPQVDVDIAPPEASIFTPQADVNVTSSSSGKRVNPIWLSLVASNVHGGLLPLPQISPCYLRIKDVNLPVSFIKKYLAKKLGLDNEDKVEISLLGRPLLPTAQLHNLTDQWLHTPAPTTQTIVSVGSSAEDFVMILSYALKPHPI